MAGHRDEPARQERTPPRDPGPTASSEARESSSSASPATPHTMGTPTNLNPLALNPPSRSQNAPDSEARSRQAAFPATRLHSPTGRRASDDLDGGDRQHVRFSLDSGRDRLARYGPDPDHYRDDGRRDGADAASSNPRLSTPGAELYTIPSRGDMESPSHLPPAARGGGEPSRAQQGRGRGQGRGGQRTEATDAAATTREGRHSYESDSSVEQHAITPIASAASGWDFKGLRGRGSRGRRRGSSKWDVMKARAGAAYTRYIVEGLLRRRPLPPSADGRHVPLPSRRAKAGKALTDERTGKPYVSNFIRSSRYTVWDFVPKQLLFQFSKLANFYFLLVAIMQMIPGLSTTGTYTTIAPLCAFVAFSMAKEGYDDYRRYRLDKVENRSEVWVLDAHDRVRRTKTKAKKAGAATDEEAGDDAKKEPRSGGPWARVQWQDVRVGDVVRLRRDDNVPADLVLLHATGPNCVAYIETMALDGETNLKSKQASPLLAERCGTVEGLRACDAIVVSEDPNLDLYSYHGRVTVGGETLPLALGDIVYRGSTLRNTADAFGLVVNSGEECKIRMNANKNVRAKAPAMQYIVNRIVVFLVFFVVVLSVGLTGGYYIWRDQYERRAHYLTGATVSFKEILIAFIIMFNTLIPLSLYISLEIIKIGQLFLLQDVEMYDPVSDTPMVANTTTILENLGQVTHVFSDKTGTLTENVMRFRKMTVAGTAWLHDMDLRKDAEERERKIQKSLSRRKGKSKQSLPGGHAHHRAQASRRPSEHKSIAGSDMGGEEPLVEKPQPARRESVGGSTSRWRSTVRPDGHGPPEPKTEELLEYIRRWPNTAFSRKARHFLLCIALCHTCLPETKANGEIDFQAASPDELALVEAARDLGMLLIDRPAQSIKLRLETPDGSVATETYQILDVIEFSSKRKRMSIILRMPDGRICIFCKGADSIIMPRLRQNHLALQKAITIERRASKRKSVEQERAIRRLSASLAGATTTTTAATPRNSITLGRATGRSSSVVRRLSLGAARRGSRTSTDVAMAARRSMADDLESWITRRETEDLWAAAAADSYQATAPAATTARPHSLVMPPTDVYEGLVDESLATNDGAVFERCFQHIDDFASEGLRTLLYAYRYLDEGDYANWKSLYQAATTSLVDRQERIEEAADQIEQGFDLAGATAIEDKLQDGVPETIDKLRRANVKVWMITGDKRETAINIGHSARLCKPFSEIYVLDSMAPENLRDKIVATLNDVTRRQVPHSVLVIDGHTLGEIEAASAASPGSGPDSDLAMLFYDLAVRVDSVICCRASPAQKANLVKAVRHQMPDAMTLAIGDGANDIGMIQASHVGIGISGREGLQAARIADYSIAQFRFLQRLLFVHGRWNYIRTGKYILATFWKEIVFFLVQAHYQRFNGYTGTSLFENWSLTVFNSFFTSLPVILLGIFEKDLQAETLLAVPELYTFGQLDLGFNFWQYVGWMLLGVSESLVIFYVIWGNYRDVLFTSDSSLYAIGTLCFTVSVLFINIKLLVIELHHKTFISFLGLFISATGWFVWNIFLAAVYPNKQSIYLVHRAFLHNFGRNLEWWTSVVLALAAVIILELVVGAVRRVYWPRDQDLMQRIERDQRVRDVLKEHSAENGEAATAAAGGAGGGNAAAGEGDASTKKGKSSVEVTYVGRGRGYDYDDDEPARPASAVSATSFHRFDWEPPAAPAPPVPPLPQPGQQPRSQPPRRARTSTDGYVPPPFTPPAEERENPFDAGSNSSGPAAGPDGGGGHGLASRWLSGRRGAGGPEPMSIELQSPPAGRRGGR